MRNMANEIKILTTTDGSVASSFESKIPLTDETTLSAVLNLMKKHLFQMGIPADVIEAHIFSGRPEMEEEHFSLDDEDDDDDDDDDEDDDPDYLYPELRDENMCHPDGTLKDRFLPSSELSDDGVKRRMMIEKKVADDKNMLAFLKEMESNKEFLREIFKLYLEETISS